MTPRRHLRNGYVKVRASNFMLKSISTLLQQICRWDKSYRPVYWSEDHTPKMATTEFHELGSSTLCNTPRWDTKQSTPLSGTHPPSQQRAKNSWETHVTTLDIEGKYFVQKLVSPYIIKYVHINPSGIWKVQIFQAASNKSTLHNKPTN
jgi:hypothetical protein